jgi:predicted short-subunit dehydrogenase-like oxidoreductase (DUF2520 family)
MRIGLIGCGRVGQTIFHILKKSHNIIGAYDINKKREKSALKLLGIKKNPTYGQLISRCDAIFIATPDDEILKAYIKMYDRLSGTKYVFHFSAILPADLLPKKNNIHRASVHPFATFPKIAVQTRRQHLVLSIEGDRAAVNKARSIFSPKYFTLKRLRKEDKDLYHLIGVFSSNLFAGLVASVYDIAKQAGWKEKELKQLVHPLITETLRNIEKYGPEDSLTGPLRRGDVATIQKHLKTLKRNKRLLKIYKELSLYIIENLTSGYKKSELRKLLEQ